MLITNWWGIFFSVGMPVIIMMFMCYYAGVEDAKERYRMAMRSSKTKINKKYY